MKTYRYDISIHSDHSGGYVCSIPIHISMDDDIDPGEVSSAINYDGPDGELENALCKRINALESKMEKSIDACPGSFKDILCYSLPLELYSGEDLSDTVISDYTYSE